MIASASVAPAAGPEATPSSGTRRGGAQAAGATPPSFEHSLRDARSHHERVPERQEPRDDGRPAGSRPAARRDGSPRPDAGTRADGRDRAGGRGRAGAASAPADPSATRPTGEASSDDSAAVSSSPTTPGDATSATTTGATQPPAVAPGVTVASGTAVPVAVTTAPALVATTPLTDVTSAASTATGTAIPAGGAVAAVGSEALGGTGGAAETASPPSSVSSTTVAHASTQPAAVATGTPASALMAAADSTPTASLPTDAAAPGRSHAGASMTTAAPASSPEGGLPLTVTADVVAPVAGATTTTTRTTSPGAEGTAPQLVAAPTTSGGTSSVAAAGPQASSAAVAPAPTWVQQAVQTQLSGRLLAAARGSEPGAVQRLTLHLHPADLGSVQVVATLDDGTLTLQLAAGNPTTRDALRASLATLRSDLAAAGLDGARLDVSDQPPSSHHGPTHQQGTGGDGSPRHLGAAADHAPTTGAGSAGHRHDASGTGTQPRAGSHPNQGVDLHL